MAAVSSVPVVLYLHAKQKYFVPGPGLLLSSQPADESVPLYILRRRWIGNYYVKLFFVDFDLQPVKSL